MMVACAPVSNSHLHIAAQPWRVEVTDGALGADPAGSLPLFAELELNRDGGSDLLPSFPSRLGSHMMKVNGSDELVQFRKGFLPFFWILNVQCSSIP